MSRLFAAAFLAFSLLPAGFQIAQVRAAEPAVIRPTAPLRLLEGKDLSQKWYTWLTDAGHEDPRSVFSLSPEGVLHISGDGYGGLTTRDEYADYYLVMEYRWGGKTWGEREHNARDSGLLLHCQGPDGNFDSTAEKRGAWMNSVECQIIEGGVGDILVLDGKNAEGHKVTASATCHVKRDADDEPCWNADGPAEVFTKGRINWYGRDPKWDDVRGFRGPHDVDSPGEEWTKLEIFARGDTLVYRVNGVVVNRAERVSPSHGKILVQTEGAELFVRNLELRPLPAEKP